jgi:hypothetical protein
MRRDVQIARPINVVVEDKTDTFKFEHIEIEARQKITNKSNEVQKFREERSRWESDRGPGTAEGLRRGEQKTPADSKSNQDAGATPLKGGFAGDKGTGTAQRATPGQAGTVRSQSESEKVKIPSSPVSDKRGAFSIFRKGPPSRPSDERKTEVKESRRETDTPKGGEASRESDTRESDDSRKDRGERGKGDRRN